MVNRNLKSLIAFVAMIATLSGFAASEITSRQPVVGQDRPYNILVGDMKLDLSTQLKVTYDDNNNKATDNDTQEDATVGELGLGFGLYYPISRQVEIDLKGYVGYKQNLSGESENGWVAKAGDNGTLALDMQIGDNGILTLIDTLNVGIETVETADDDNTGDVTMLNNDAAAQYEVGLTELATLTVRGGRKDIESLDNGYSHRDRHVWYGAMAFDWNFNSEMSLGPYGSYRNHNHNEEGNNDANEWEVGLRWHYNPSDATRILVSAGYQEMDFDNSHSPAAAEDSENFVGLVSMSQTLTEQVWHVVSAAYGARIGSARLCNYSEDTVVNYGLNYKITDQLSTGYNFAFLHSREAGDNGETGDTFSNGINLTYRMGDKVKVAIGYRRTDKDSDEDDRKYRRNETWASVSYDF